ncbi:ATP-binding cassette domain-containing protein [Alphaproteobacteria bacterium]|jgi:zinc transport system ATP-binding protein|nr:ATP-binding cassette domain-containing protein [Alphaproteobacteria bacterium]MDA9914292.1 ATP-binding cassette domain-containing protein [Alphaproteobacteria bacterium]MDB2584403.1 ATP-binding cassette domain-containing protein [Alphaproteobacteria bacterium]MDB3916463.1 ATP-binding cassette domain-containing protein [Alphaproteobacteria bacterium]
MKLTNALISAKNVSVLKNQKSILENIDIQINKKDFITIIGPNGAGKTMLLKCLMGFYKPTSGMIERKEKLKIGYMPQSINVINTMPMTVKGFITVKKKYDDISLHKVITEVNLGEIVNKQLSVLSGGEMQRVLLARSLLNNPDLLILDEPAQNLDISGQLNFYKLIQEIYSKRDISILMISHDLHLVMVSTKKVLCLYKHICCSGAPQQIAKDPEFLSMFGKDMANMMSIYQHSHDHDHDHNYLVGEE